MRAEVVHRRALLGSRPPHHRSTRRWIPLKPRAPVDGSDVFVCHRPVHRGAAGRKSWQPLRRNSIEISEEALLRIMKARPCCEAAGACCGGEGHCRSHASVPFTVYTRAACVRRSSDPSRERCHASVVRAHTACRTKGWMWDEGDCAGWGLLGDCERARARQCAECGLLGSDLGMGACHWGHAMGLQL